MRITKNDHEFVTTNDPWFGWFWATVNDGTWEPETFRIFDRFLAKNTTFIDAGAWIGPTVLYASRLCNRCFALEPSPMSYRELVNNLEANCSYNVLALQEALWEYDGFLTLGNDGGSTGGSSTRVDSNKNNFQVPCHTLTTFVSEHSILDPIFLKMDVEGAEEEILKSKDFFAERKPVLYVSLHPQWFRNPGAALETVKQIGKLYRHRYDAELNETEINPNLKALVFTD